MSKVACHFFQHVLLLAAALSAFAGTVAGAEIKVLNSGGFTAAYNALLPEFEKTSHYKVVTSFGASMGNAPDAIPKRLERGEKADVVILALPALEKLIDAGKVIASSRVDLGRSGIGMVVRVGAPVPDIGSVESLRRTLLDAKSIAFSDSASGHYLVTELFPELGIAKEVDSKCRRVEGEMVGAVVARGGAEIGFQQISELLPVKGVVFAGALPAQVQRETIFSAGVVVGAAEPDGAQELIKFLSSSHASDAIKKSGLELVATTAQKMKKSRD